MARASDIKIGWIEPPPPRKPTHHIIMYTEDGLVLTGVTDFKECVITRNDDETVTYTITVEKPQRYSLDALMAHRSTLWGER